mmetsp:Transcript_13787/g.20807  ORF Transcript_13787/g.20807 Transcript_13787/m.20807 type:complete len:325 (+) Transcript_13787:33-1007(+)
MESQSGVPKTVEELLSLKGLENFREDLEAKGYDDLQFIVTASKEELVRLGRDTGMSFADILNLEEAAALVREKISTAFPDASTIEYFEKSRKEGSMATKTTSTSSAANVSERALVKVEEKLSNLKVTDLEQQFNRLILQATDTSISPEDREIFEETGSGPTYGYMTWKGVSEMLTSYDTKGKVFYDLGSGVGRPVFAAAMQFPELKKCIGVELSDRRHKQAIKVLNLMEEGSTKRKIEFRCESMLDTELQEADILYISSLCFPKDFLNRLGDHLDEQLKVGTIVMSSKEIPMHRAKLVRRPIVGMSWNKQHQLHGYVMNSPIRR